MPADILATDTLFPELNGKETADQKFEMVTDYLWLLREQLTFALTNLGIANFNASQLSKLSAQITEPFSVVLAGQETQLTELRVEMGRIRTTITDVETSVGEELDVVTQKLSTVEQTADGLSLTVSEIQNDISSLSGAVDGLELKLTDLSVTAEGIQASVTKLETSVGENLEALDNKLTGDLNELESLLRTEISVTAEGISATVSKVETTANAAKKSADSAQSTADTVKNNYISKSSVTSTSSGFELSVMGTNNSGIRMTRMKLTKDGLQIYNKSGTAVFDFDTESGDLEIMGTITGSEIYGSTIYSCKKTELDNPYFSHYVLSGDGFFGEIYSGGKFVKHGISITPIASDAHSIAFYEKGTPYFEIARYSGSTYNSIASAGSLIIQVQPEYEGFYGTVVTIDAGNISFNAPYGIWFYGPVYINGEPLPY